MCRRITKVVCVTVIAGLCILFIIATTIISHPALFVPLAMLMDQKKVFETNDLADYGKITGNNDNTAAEEHITAFFPEKLDQSFFETKNYHYKAINRGKYAYEAVLEVVISDSHFEDYVSSIIGESDYEVFEWDDNFACKTLAKDYQISSWSEDLSKFFVDKATVSLILFSPQENKVVFVAIGIFNEGEIQTTDLNYFFEKFGIEARLFATRVGTYTRE